MHVENSAEMRLLRPAVLGKGLLLAAWLFAVAGCSRRGAAPEPLRFAPGDEVKYVPVTEKLIALTYDDGPAPPYTTAILDILKQEGMQATFFLVGQHVEQHPGVVQRILAEGHEIGSHTYSHPRMDKLPIEEVRRELELTEQVLAAAAGTKTPLFRSAFGYVTPAILQVCRERNYLLVGWSSDGNDWNYQSARDIVDKMLGRLEPGEIVLLHDGAMTLGHHDQTRVVQATREVVRALRERGYRSVTVSELIRHYRQSPEEIQFPGGVRYLGMRLVPDSVPAGRDVRASYYWYFMADAPRTPLSVAVHFRDSRGRIAFQNDHTLTLSHLKTAEEKAITPAGIVPGTYHAHLAVFPAGSPARIHRLAPRTLLPVRQRMAQTGKALVVTPAETPP